MKGSRESGNSQSVSLVLFRGILAGRWLYCRDNGVRIHMYYRADTVAKLPLLRMEIELPLENEI